MDIDDFYAGDARRRDGEDDSFGLGWSDASQPDLLFDLYWNEGSQELYLMAKPRTSPWLSYTERAGIDVQQVAWIEHRIVGAAEQLIHPRHIQAKTGGERPEPPDHEKDALTEQLSVEILATIPTKQQVEALLKGWEDVMPEPDSVAWLRERVGVGEAAQ